MLSPDTIHALEQTLQAVVDECGGDPQYQTLLDAVDGVKAEVSNFDAGHPADPAASGDPHGFDAAAQAMASRRKGGA